VAATEAMTVEVGDHAAHEGDDDDNAMAAADEDNTILEDISAAGTAGSRDVDADVVETALEVHVVPLPYWRRCRWRGCGKWVACVTKAQDVTIARQTASFSCILALPLYSMKPN
jgi:hypothetical protein